MENYNFDLCDEDKDYFYKLYFNIRKYYNILLRQNDKDNSECRDEAYDTILCDGTDLGFFEEYMKFKGMKYSDIFIEL
tara:strand:- start:1281 stop:1514 length:234 start_codon:yes stop_codon:yes gene_type:complete